MSLVLTRVLRRGLAVGAVVVALGSGCTAGPSTTPNAASGGSATTVSTIPNGTQVSPATFRSVLQNPGTVVLDVRTPGEFAGGHLPGARNIDSTDPRLSELLSGLPRDTRYAVYCRTGSRSAAVVRTMTGLGFTSTVDLAGGIQAWEAAGGEVVRGP